MYNQLHVTAIIPALNEQEAIGQVVSALIAQQGNHGQPIIDQIIVADNGSIDLTATLANVAGANVVFEPKRGYGAACLAAINSIVATDVVLFIDGDCSVQVSQIILLLDPVSNGADIAIGSRCLGYIQPGSMSLPQRIGNGLIARIISLLWQAQVTDIGPFRAIRYSALQELAMQDRAYGWTVKMQVKALQQGLIVREIPVDCLVRVGRSKVSGTVRGVVGAAFGMFGMIVRLWWQGRQADKASLPI
ncbi:glycosyltransferase family 2 protein [Methylomonas sp. LW13]|uniref:glycosyltransferase family 2 protein n=1 Tax=unclassified Methylomonas TaxID=2608980 RepID=UPI00051AD32C|nr:MULTISPECIES: glycosyltransferase family 2 protein [unclassified Methylomonas]PKD39647.1 glycosyltransferase family 2 protein [Methylomonas sp. Kb3]QBC27742.1 glycosyltransferase family 2 protein [Methylomonas sp. LW13]